MVHRRELKDNQVRAVAEEDISEVEVLMLGKGGEETFGFQVEEGSGVLEEDLTRDQEDDR